MQATWIAHWPMRDIPADDEFLHKLLALATKMGFRLTATPCGGGKLMEPRDLLVYLRQWLMIHAQTNIRHFGYSDPSGHPHGYAGVVIPEWDMKQRLDEIDEALTASAKVEGK